ncbi:MAG: hypothetical protein HY319_30965 [Armatimonadetes bacterium]|nr:hypothetical protein [Armatimonadota bacterium]
MANIKVGQLVKVQTVDGRTYVGTLTGYAEVGQGEDEVLEEIYLSGCGERLLTLQMSNVKGISQSDCWFEFEER